MKLGFLGAESLGKDVRVRDPVHALKPFAARAGQPALLVSAGGFGKPLVPAPAATLAWTAAAEVAPR